MGSCAATLLRTTAPHTYTHTRKDEGNIPAYVPYWPHHRRGHAQAYGRRDHDGQRDDGRHRVRPRQPRGQAGQSALHLTHPHLDLHRPHDGHSHRDRDGLLLQPHPERVHHHHHHHYYHHHHGRLHRQEEEEPQVRYVHGSC